MKRRGQGGSATGNGQHERESLRFKRREMERGIHCVGCGGDENAEEKNTFGHGSYLGVCVRDVHGSSEALAIEIGGGSTMGFGYGGLGDLWWIHHGFNYGSF